MKTKAYLKQKMSLRMLWEQQNQVMEGSYYQATKQVEKAYPV